MALTIRLSGFHVSPPNDIRPFVFLILQVSYRTGSPFRVPCSRSSTLQARPPTVFFNAFIIKIPVCRETQGNPKFNLDDFSKVYGTYSSLATFTPANATHHVKGFKLFLILWLYLP